MSIWAIITGAGKSRRMKAKNKLLLPLKGKPLLCWTLAPFESSPLITGVILLAPEAFLEDFKELIASFGFKKVKEILPGGENRQESVYRGFTTLPGEAKLVVVHDGARPLLSDYLLEKVILSAEKSLAAILAVPVYDSLKQVSGGLVVKNLPREGIWAAQTPQVFERELLGRAFQKAWAEGFVGTDEASLVSRLPYPISVVLGSPENLKITTPQDLAAAELLARQNLRS